jgi:hypothetical protein
VESLGSVLALMYKARSHCDQRATSALDDALHCGPLYRDHACRMDLGLYSEGSGIVPTPNSTLSRWIPP